MSEIRYCGECGTPLKGKPRCGACGWEAPFIPDAMEEETCDVCDSPKVYLRAGRSERTPRGLTLVRHTIRRCYEHTHPIWRNWFDNYLDKRTAGATDTEARAFADKMQAKRDATHKRPNTPVRPESGGAPVDKQGPQAVGDLLDGVPTP